MNKGRRNTVKRVSDTSGFTLIELLIAITILVVIIGIMVALFAGNNGSTVAKAERFIDTGRQLAQAAELYYTQENKMPSDIDNLTEKGDLNSAPANWQIVTADSSNAVSYFGDTSKKDDTVEYTGSDITKDVCEKIVKSSHYYNDGSNTSTKALANGSGSTIANGMYVLVNGTTPVTDVSQCANGVTFYYLIRADVE